MANLYFFEGTTYYSPGDEDAHFRWLKGIASVRSIYGEGRRVILDIDSAAVTASDQRELEAVYRRYGGDLAQLDGFTNTRSDGGEE